MSPPYFFFPPPIAGHITHSCCQNYGVKEHTDEDRNAHFLRILTVRQCCKVLALVGFSSLFIDSRTFCLLSSATRAAAPILRCAARCVVLHCAPLTDSSQWQTSYESVVLPLATAVHERLMQIVVLVLALAVIKIYFF